MSVEDKIGGYPVEWFVKAPSEHFKCGICLDVLKNPHQCKNGHTFCHSCISLALKDHLECPTCKTALSPNTLSLTLSLRNLIDEMLVKCCHDGSCEWTKPLEQSMKHFKLCSMRSVPCPLRAHHVCTDKNCTGMIKRKDVNSHVSGGSKRDIADAMLIMAETIAYQKKEIELLHEFILSGETKIHTIDNESTFVGTLKNGEMEGFGFLKQSNGATYSGHFSNGTYCGFGVLRQINLIWSGEWEYGNLNGRGMVRSPVTMGETLQNCASMKTYIGAFKDDRKHGLGRTINTDTTDVGPFENGLSHGKLTCFLPKDDVLVGSYEKGKRCIDLPCSLTAGNGSVFVGIIDSKWQFIEGKFTTAEGVLYEGTFCDEADQHRLNGTGAITYTYGSIYTGEFRSGLKHGKGTLDDSNGVVSTLEGDWVDGTLVNK